MLENLDPTKHGAKTPADFAAFLVGAAAGGLVDATLNSFGFAEPFVMAGLSGAGALGLKKAAWDVPVERRRSRLASRIIRDVGDKAEVSRSEGNQVKADCLFNVLEEGMKKGPFRRSNSFAVQEVRQIQYHAGRLRERQH